MKPWVYLPLVLFLGLIISLSRQQRSAAPEAEPEPETEIERIILSAPVPLPEQVVPPVRVEEEVPRAALTPESQEFVENMKEIQEEVSILENEPLESDREAEVP